MSEHIKFEVCATRLTLSSVNGARTSYAEVVLEEPFFHEYSTDFSNIAPEGFSNGTYSILVNSKHLATLFRNLDANDWSYIVLKIYWAINASASMRYKFLVEVKTKKLIVKKYQTNYQPVFLDRVTVGDVYKQALARQEHKDDAGHRINTLTIEMIILKNFLDMIPLSTESFKIGVKSGKLSFNGYTRQILKDKEYLRQPMSLTITMDLDEVTETNLQGLPDTSSIEVCFRLKDFKNFMGLSSALAYIEERDASNPDKVSYIETLFRNPGDPIIFELSYSQHCKVRFVQITARESSEGANDTTISMKDLSLEFRAPVPVQKEMQPEGPRVDYVSQILDDTGTGKRPQENFLNVFKRQKVDPPESTEATDYSDSSEEEYYGPTQAPKPKSIFD